MPAFPISQNADLMKKWRSMLNDEVLKSPCTPVNIPNETLIIRMLRSLREHTSKHPQQRAVIEALNQDRSLTYQQIHDRALSFAAFLTSRGFKIGDRVTAAFSNSIECPVVHLGTWAAGGSMVGSSEAFKLYETVYQLRDSTSSVAVVSEKCLDMFLEAIKECPTVKLIICVRSSEKRLPNGVIDFEETIRYELLPEIAPVTMDMECLIYYSSGTTGLPKGVIHTHRTFHCAIEMMRSHWQHEIYSVLQGTDEVDWYKESRIIVSSCFHISGFTMLNWNLLTGSPVVLMKSFDGDVCLDVIEKFKPRALSVSPPIFAFLAKDSVGKAAPLSSVQIILCATAPLSKELSDEFLAFHPNVKYIVQAYGMTETGICHLPLLLEEGANASGGVVAACYEQKIVDPDTLVACKQGQRGEVWVRGAPQTIGYLNKPDATQALVDEDGWVHTGDIGYIDERGLLYIVDRMKDMIKVNFKNQSLQVAPAQIEGVLVSHHKIREVAIVGIASNQTCCELIRAFVVKADETLTGKEVEDLVSDKLAEFMCITGGVHFVDAIPRSRTGKILRRVLRETIGA